MSKFNFTFQQDSRDNTGEDDCFPSRLKEHDQWLVIHDKPWDDYWHKRPKYPSEGWNEDGASLLPFEEAYSRYESTSNTGIAFRFTDDGPFIGFDFDKVRVDGEFTEEVLDLVRRLDSYTEVSSSGNGLHVIAEGEKMADRKTKGPLSTYGELEVYDTNRYFVLTGDVYDGLTSVESRPSVVRAVQDGHLPEVQNPTSTGQQKPVSEQEFVGGQTDVTPNQVRRTIEEYGKCSWSEVDHSRVLRWWDGYNSGKPSASEADMAFIEQLYFWCRGDRQLMDECFRASARYHMRDQPTPKWDEVHYSNGDTYGERHIRIACRRGDDTFNGRYVQEE